MCCTDLVVLSDPFANFYGVDALGVTLLPEAEKKR